MKIFYEPNKEIESKCDTCIFSFICTCKCYASEHYNKKLPDEACDYYLKDDVDKLLLDDSNKKEE